MNLTLAELTMFSIKKHSNMTKCFIAKTRPTILMVLKTKVKLEVLPKNEFDKLEVLPTNLS